jgi:hypothetical protein
VVEDDAEELPLSQPVIPRLTLIELVTPVANELLIDTVLPSRVLFE